MEQTANEVKLLRSCINDLVSILALSAIWTADDPANVISTLLDVLLRILRLDLAYARLTEVIGGAPVELVRAAAGSGLAAQEVGRVLTASLAGRASRSHFVVPNPMGAGEVSIAFFGFGLQDEIGIFVAGSQRADFPTAIETLLLRVAINQAAVALHEARILSEHRRAAEEALRETQSELAHVSRVMTIGALTASIAHEVNQPLAAIIANGSACLRWLAHDVPNLDEARSATERIIRDGNRASEVIQRIRDLVKKTSLNKVPLDINDVIREVTDLVQTEVRNHRVVLHTVLSADLPPVLGDRVQLQQILLNLLLNGIEAMDTITDRPRDLRITSQRPTSDTVMVAVQDSGTGLSPESMTRLFDPFFTTKPKGMGMGLSISRSISEAHGGDLRVSANDRGATFELTLPAGS